MQKNTQAENAFGFLVLPSPGWARGWYTTGLQ
jgi:hypothetical protein